MYLIGLTGGIASGKSLVSARLAERGAVVIDADLLAREVVEPGTPALEAIAGQFGASVIDGEGRLDRAALGAIVFADPARLEILNGITHPAVRALTRERISAAEADDPNAIVVYDVPLLAETSVAHGYDLVVVVEAAVAERIRRMVEIRGMSRDDVERRLRSQASDDERRAIAHVVIDNTGTIEQTRAQVDALWETVAGSAAGKH
ncbi:dephospho-CoA kinase [Marisediminicola antarctica]|uniref:Dephospho-CoA kinase n=1 Tax=Marisediminicola antarctica TaxID=674079 RepID=A0A7L5AJR5_9MICO|nr:dephospho-CoA kinase [Marisediminicola antarctica]QHO70025.1 dephospho-CoA kinase [Marisediminicola antarctica]